VDTSGEEIVKECSVIGRIRYYCAVSEKSAIILKSVTDSESQAGFTSVLPASEKKAGGCSLKDIAVVWLLKLQSWLPLSTARVLGSFLGQVLWWCKSRMATTTLINLRLCFPDMPEHERNELARQSMRESCKTLMEGGAVWLWPAKKTLDSIREIINEELLKKSVETGKGVLVISPHLGNWEVIGLYLGQCGYAPSVQLYQTPRKAVLDQLLLKARCRTGATMVNTDNKGVAALLKSLRQGAISGILPDQIPHDGGGEFAPFFGVPAFTMTLLSRLIEKTGAVVVLAYADRLENQKGPDGFRLEFREVDARLYDSNLQTSLAGLNATVEKAIMEAPHLYHWEYKRFRRQPEGVQRPY
jgi:KDO2-lipid IV(A) lauroyltransferase